MKIEIIGIGWVGKAMYYLFPESVIQDPNEGLFSNNDADVSFVCVPTPNNPDGSLDTSIVEDVVKNCNSPLIVIRSTVQPGTCDYLEDKYKKNIVMQPEYLGETVAHPLLDETDRSFLIIGGRPQNRRKLIELYQTVYNANISIRQVTNREAEVIKLSENRAIAFKVAQCQELYDACEKNGVDYYTIQQAVYGDDPRFTLWFTHIYPDKRGFKSKCIPKDVYAWSEWAGKPELTEELLKYNDKLIKEKNG
jgi:UDPglucose 6-dehydrogenase